MICYREWDEDYRQTKNVFYCILRSFYKQDITSYMAYVCIVLALFIVVISLLTKKKEAYHINILNQVFFDLVFLIYQKVCYHKEVDKRRNRIHSFGYSNKCQDVNMMDFFGGGDILQSLHRAFNDFQPYLHCFTSFSLVLFSSTRFVAIFFPIWYNRVFSLKKHIFIIIFANFLYALLVVLITFVSIYINLTTKEILSEVKYLRYKKHNISKELAQNKLESIITKEGISAFMHNSVDPLLSLLSILPVIFSILILLKLVPHFLKNTNQNHKQMMSNLRISLTLLFQSLFLLVYALFILYRDTYLFVNLYNNYYAVSNLFNNYVYDYEHQKELNIYRYYDEIQLPFLNPLADLANLNNANDKTEQYVLVHSFLIIRIFLDYIIIFFVMPTYREAWSGFLSKIRPTKCSLAFGLVIIVFVYALVLRHSLNRSIVFEEISPDLNKPIILEWARDPPEHLITFLNAYSDQSSNKCPYKCHFTNDRRLYNAAKMVVFHPVNLDLNDLPPHRCDHQLYVFFTRESPQNIRNSEYEKLRKDYFNLTVTYRLDSDLFAGYDRFEKITNGTTPNEIWDDSEVIHSPGFDLTISAEQIEKKLLNKKKLALQFVSNCNTPSSRESYIHELEKHMNITQYGRCQGGFFGRIFNIKKCKNDCEEKEIDQHYFYLAFENSVCKHYVSEKFWRLKKLIVPIVLNRKVYEGIAPSESFIAVDDFETPKKLADHLKNLVEHPNDYKKFLEWTKFYKKTKSFSNAKCELCRMATHPTKKSIDNFRKWWIDESYCIKNYGKILINKNKA